MSEQLEQLHLADLHARAAELGIDGYRKLRREELISRIADGARGGSGGDGEAPKRRRRGRRGGRGRGGAGRERLAGAGAGSGEGDRSGDRASEPARPPRERKPRAPRDDQADEPADEASEQVSGVVELTRQRHGFVRISGLTPDPDDVYLSASQVRRCELRPGDDVSGPARGPRRGERHRAMVHIDAVNGAEPQTGERLDFDALTPEPADRRIPLSGDADLLARAVNTLAPLAYGQRILVRADVRSGRTTLLRSLARAISAAEDAPEVIVLLVDERPEELPGWKEGLDGAQFAAAPADLSPVDQTRTAVLALERARRRVEAGADVVLIADSLTRLAVAAGGVGEVKRLFGSGRELSEDGAGSLTVIATVLGGDHADVDVEKAVATTENSRITLDASLAEEGISPALRFGDCRADGDAALLSPAEFDELGALRKELEGKLPPEAAALLRDRLEG